LGLDLSAAKIVINSQNWELFAKKVEFFQLYWSFFAFIFLQKISKPTEYKQVFEKD
jgi:hypothetical protein